MAPLKSSERDTPLSLANFPAEIVRLILEHLGRESGREAARLVCISRLVHAWILPVLYETVVLKHAKALRQILHNVTAHSDLTPHVRNLCLQLELSGVDTSIQVIRDISALLLQCQHIRSLYLNSTTLSLPYNNVLLPRLSDLHCGSWGAWMTHDILAFRPLTHLRADLVHNQGVSSSWAPLLFTPSSVLPHLTHLALCADGRTAPESGRRATTQFLRGVLAARPRLVMLVVTVWFCWGPAGIMMYEEIADPRLCLLTSNHWGDEVVSLSDWKDAVQGQQSVWDKARRVMERHHARGAPSVAVGSIEGVYRN